MADFPNQLEIIDSRLIMPIIEVLQQYDAPVYKLLEQANLPVALLDGERHMCASINWWKLMANANDYLNIDDLGFVISKQDKLNSLSMVFDPIFANNQTLHQALHAFFHLKGNVSTKGHFWLDYQLRGTWFVRQGSDWGTIGQVPMEQMVLMNMVYIVRHYLGIKWQPYAVKLQHQENQDVVKRYFPNALIMAGRQHSEIFIMAEELSLIDETTTRVEQAVSKLTVSERLYEVLKSYRREEIPDVTKAALLMGLSKRQLQRSLVQENTNFRQIMNRLKVFFAKQYLKNPAIQMIDISTALGYDNAANFTRAFKQWSGVTPSQYRNSLGDK